MSPNAAAAAVVPAVVAAAATSASLVADDFLFLKTMHLHVTGSSVRHMQSMVVREKAETHAYAPELIEHIQVTSEIQGV
ncbi:MAG: hypothetical protein ABJQ14_09080 [Hyphomicrobiales bacterium]